MEDSKIVIVIRWISLKRSTIEAIAGRFGFDAYVSVNRRTEVTVKSEDIPVLEECERRGLIKISR